LLNRKGGWEMRLSIIDTEKTLMIQGRDKYQQLNPGYKNNNNKENLDRTYFKEELEESIEEINKTVEALHKDLRFQVHEKSDRLMVEVIDVIKNEVIKEIPPRQLLDMLGRIREMVGLIIDEKI